MLEDETPKPAPDIPLDRLSETELEQRIKDLEAEIAACLVELDRKRQHRTAADALFKSGS